MGGDRAVKRFDIRYPSRSLMILVILILSVGLGFLFDFICSCIEKTFFPRDYDAYVEASATRNDIPAHLVYAVIKCESGFDSSAVSNAGAVGLMQIMPDTFTWLTDDILYDHFDEGMLHDPETNIRYGTYYLARLFRQFGSWELALAAYNAGPSRVNEWLEDPTLSDGEGGLAEIPLEETRRYVKKVTDAWKTYDRLYGTPVEVIGSDTESAS